MHYITHPRGKESSVSQYSIPRQQQEHRWTCAHKTHVLELAEWWFQEVGHVSTKSSTKSDGLQSEWWFQAVGHVPIKSSTESNGLQSV